MPLSSGILDRTRHAGLDDKDAHGVLAFSRSMPIGSKRTLMPGRSRQQGSADLSNSFHGVFPMTCHPPGVSKG
jgi:hypothetical protein